MGGRDRRGWEQEKKEERDEKKGEMLLSDTALQTPLGLAVVGDGGGGE